MSSIRQHVFFLSACLIFVSVLPSSDASEVDDLVSRFWQWRLKTSPEYGTKYGFHDRDGELEQMTPEAIEQTVDEAQQFLQETNFISDAHLPVKDRTNLAVLKDVLSTYIQGYHYRYYGAYLGITIYEHPIMNMKTLLSWMPFKKQIDFKRAIQRYKAFAIRIEQQKALMLLAFEEGMTRPNNKIDDIIAHYTSWPQDANMTFLYKPFRNISTVIDNATLARSLTEEVLDVISQKVSPTIRSFADFLKNVYKSKLRSEPGVGALPGGKEYYASCLKWHLSLNMTAREVHNLGLAEVKRISSLIEKIKEENGFNGTLRTYLLHLKQDPKNLFDSKEEILGTFRRYIQNVHQHLHKVLLKVPNLPIRIKASSTPYGGNKYTEPSLDGSREGTFTASVWYPKTSTRFTKLALTLHEAEPGHHTQMSATIDGDLPNFRRAIEFRKYSAIPFNWPFYTAYVEGWALYAESLGEEMGLYTERYDLLGRYISEIFRACRLVIDTGIHDMGWSFQDAVDYLESYTSLPRSKMESEVTRYIYYPGQATSYKIGELTIMRLRKEATEELGGLFDIRAFNTAILDLGPAPLSAVEDHIRMWINSQKGASVRAEPSREGGASSQKISAYSVLAFLTVLLYISFGNVAHLL